MAAPLELINIHKTFSVGFLNLKKFEAVKGISFNLQEGEIFGLLGPNGAGKTTTLKMITGLIFPDSGSIKIFGISAKSPASRTGLGFLPENPSFYDYLSAKEFLETMAASFGIFGSERKKRVDNLLQKLGIDDKADIPLRKFSKGMQQRAGLAQALINKPKLVILDEPLSGLDPIGRRDLREIITGLKKEGTTVLLSSHILADIEEMCDRVGILTNGKLREIGRMEDLLSEGIRSTEIEVEGAQNFLDTKLFKGFNLSTETTLFGHRLTVSDDTDLQNILKILIDNNIKIKEVKRHRYSLEELFITKTDSAKTSPNNKSESDDKTDSEETK